jgi:glutamyl-tRNA synthetase
VLNYLVRLGWSHGDDEVFSTRQFIDWFDLEHVSRSAAQFNPEKLTWLNQQHLKGASDERLADLVEPQLRRLGASPERGPALSAVVALLKERATTIVHLAEAATLFYLEPHPSAGLVEEHLTEAVRPALRTLRARLAEAPAWDKVSISAAIKAALASSGLKMPQLAMPLRVIVTGRLQTPSIDAVLELLGRETVLARLAHQLDAD